MCRLESLRRLTAGKSTASLVLLVDVLRVLKFILMNVLVAPTPIWVGIRLVIQISGSLDALLNDLVRDCLQIVRPADLSEEVDECSGEVHAIIAQLGCLVIPREDVMVVVPAFTQSENGN